MPSRLSKEEMDALLGRSGDASRAAVRSTMPVRISKETMAAAKSSSAAPIPNVKDMRPTTPPKAELDGPEEDALDPSTGLGATLRGATQGGTARFGDEIGAAAMLPVEFIGRNLEKAGVVDRPKASIEGHVDQESADKANDAERGGYADVYRKLRDSLRADNATAEATHPAKYGFAEAAAGAALPMARGAVTGGALMGGMYGLGGSTAETPMGAAKDTALGAAFGGGAGTAGSVLTKGAQRAAQPLRNAAGEMGFTSLATRAQITDKLAGMGIRPEQRAGIGAEMLDRGMIPTGLNPFETPLAGANRLSREAQDVSGETIGGIYRGFDRARPHGPLPEGQAHLDASRIRDASREPLIGAGPTQLEPKNSNLARGVGEKALASNQSHPGSAEAMHREFVNARKGVNWGVETGLANTQHRQALTGAQNELKTQVGEQLGAGELSKLNSANRDYRLGAIADDLTTDSISRRAADKPFKTLTRAIATAGSSAAGGFAGGIEGAIAAGLAPKAIALLQDRGPNVVAHALNLMSKAGDSPAAAEALKRLASQLGIKAEDFYGDKLRGRFGG